MQWSLWRWRSLHPKMDYVINMLFVSKTCVAEALLSRCVYVSTVSTVSTLVKTCPLCGLVHIRLVG